MANLDYIQKSFAMIDASVEAAVASLKASGGALACGKGCTACCKQPIPITPLESVVLMEFSRHKIPRDELNSARRQWLEHVNLPIPNRPCPFLLNGGCLVYAVRPFACRRYLVKGQKCAPQTDPTISRPGDMLEPARKALIHALLATWPWYVKNQAVYGLPSLPAWDANNEKEVKLNWLKDNTTIIQNLNWTDILAGG